MYATSDNHNGVRCVGCIGCNLYLEIKSSGEQRSRMAEH